MAGSFVGVRWNTKASEFKKLVAQLKVDIFSSQGSFNFPHFIPHSAPLLYLAEPMLKHPYPTLPP